MLALRKLTKQKNGYKDKERETEMEEGGNEEKMYLEVRIQFALCIQFTINILFCFINVCMSANVCMYLNVCQCVCVCSILYHIYGKNKPLISKITYALVHTLK